MFCQITAYVPYVNTVSSLSLYISLVTCKLNTVNGRYCVAKCGQNWVVVGTCFVLQKEHLEAGYFTPKYRLLNYAVTNTLAV
jgi:hypothetical protein